MPMISCTNAQMPWKKVITSNGRLLLTGPESSSTACGQIAWPLNLTHLQVHWVSPIHTEDSPTAVSKTVNMSKRDSVNTVSSRNSLCFIIVSLKFSHGITVYSNYFVEIGTESSRRIWKHFEMSEPGTWWRDDKTKPDIQKGRDGAYTRGAKFFRMSHRKPFRLGTGFPERWR